MRFRDFKYLILSDLYRITTDTKPGSLFRHLLLGETYRYVFWMRTAKFARQHPILKLTLFPIARILLRHYTYLLGISIPFTTEIGSGFFIGHFGDIHVNGQVRIGKNCNLSQGVTIGEASRGKRKGCPVLGESVYVGPGAKIIGSITIGNNVVIGANCVVTNDIPDNAVVVGIPGKVISDNGAEGYICNTDYEDRLSR